MKSRANKRFICSPTIISAACWKICLLTLTKKTRITMGHSHAHAHGEHHHGHSHAPNNFGRSFLIAASLNTIFIIAEVIYGLKANSLALLADAGHNFSDVIGLLLAWGAWWLSKRAPTQRYTYG